MIVLHRVCKRFGTQRVLEDISVTIPAGRSVAVVGPNAAGKSTLLKCILGLVRVDSGEIWVGGVSIEQTPAYRQRMGYMPQQPRFPENLTAAEIIELVKQVRRLSGAVEEPYIERFSLAQELTKPVRALSGGTRQKLSAVLALMGEPEILVLDEPTAGLDPVTAQRFKAELRARRAAGTTVLLTTHIVSELPELVDEVLVLLEGRVVLHEPIAALATDGSPTALEEALVQRIQEG
jgi:Cu-processing system ATP-binding protein